MEADADGVNGIRNLPEVQNPVVLSAVHVVGVRSADQIVRELRHILAVVTAGRTYIVVDRIDLILVQILNREIDLRIALLIECHYKSRLLLRDLYNTVRDLIAVITGHGV